MRDSVTRQMDQSTGPSHEAIAHQGRNDTRRSIVADVAQPREELRGGLGPHSKCGQHASASLAV